jgi:hypothetical protein
VGALREWERSAPGAARSWWEDSAAQLAGWSGTLPAANGE